MHVHWRPDLYRPNPAMIPMDQFAKIVEGDTFLSLRRTGLWLA